LDDSDKSVRVPDIWARLRDATPARVGLGRVGDAQTTSAQLDFQLAHAQARGAIHGAVDFAGLAQRLGLGCVRVHSQAADRASFIRRPDFGRRLHAESVASLGLHRADSAWDVVFIVADGLSSAAIEDHAVALLHAALPALAGWRIAPVVLAAQARVALSDDIGAALNARLAVMLIGERPGLSVRNSLGIYLTYNPRPGRSDGERNCISNIHPPDGLGYEHAARVAAELVRGARRSGASGVHLKDRSIEDASSTPPLTT